MFGSDGQAKPGLAHFADVIFVASSLDLAVVVSSSVTGKTGHFSQNSLKMVKKNSFEAA